MKVKNNTQGRVKKAAIAMLVLIFALIAMNIREFEQWFLSIDSARQWMLGHGIFKAAVVFFIANTLTCAFGFPRLWGSAFAGAVFGGPIGLLVSLPSSIMGAWITFEFGRRMKAQRLFVNITAKRGNTAIPSFTPDFLQTTLLRQLPIPGVILTIIFSATSMSRKVFITGSTAGFIPGAVIASFLGYSATTKQTLSSLTITSGAILLAITLLAYLQHRRRHSID